MARDGTRQIEVCLGPADITYTFGAPGGEKELSLSEPVATVAHRPWNGFGRSIWETTTFSNEGFSYEVYISVDRLTDEHPTQSGVNVWDGGAEVASVGCDKGSDVIGLFAVGDAKAAAGLCWDDPSETWGACGQ